MGGFETKKKPMIGLFGGADVFLTAFIHGTRKGGIKISPHTTPHKNTSTPN